MLQTTKPTKHPPQILPSSGRARGLRKEKKSALDTCVRASIMPIGDEPDLLDLMCYLKDDNDIGSAVALYGAYRTIANVLCAAQNEPRTQQRSSDYLEDEYSRAWAKAYLVADFLKDMPPNKHWDVWRAQVLLDCAFQMDATVEEVAAIASEIAASPIEPVAGGRAQSRPTTATTSNCPAEELAREYEQIAAKLVSSQLENEGAVEDALERRLVEMVDVASEIPARSDTGTAFLIMMAAGEIDRILNNNDRKWQEAAATRLMKLLYGLLERFEDEVDALPATRKWAMPAYLDPRESQPDKRHGSHHSIEAA